MFRVGCSGWSYKDWRGRVYDADAPATTWFAQYADRFDTVELNNTFYRLPAVTTVEQWAAQAPPGFLYAVKVGQFVTHRVKLKDPERWLGNHLERARRLGEHLGPNLLQLPPRWRRDVGRLDAFLAAAPRDVRWAVELRDPSWVDDEVFATLEAHRAALCIHDLLADHPWIRTTDWTYLRFHGPHALDHRYRGRYTGHRLWRVAERIGGWLDEGADVFAYFNNDFNGDAVRDATWLRERVRRRTPHVGEAGGDLDVLRRRLEPVGGDGGHPLAKAGGSRLHGSGGHRAAPAPGDAGAEAGDGGVALDGVDIVDGDAEGIG